jgi:hypothetical protein
MFHHLPNLSVDLFGIQLPVPKPERPDAMSATRVLKSRMKRLERTGRRKPGREMRQTAKVDSTKAGAGNPEKIPSCDLGHGMIGLPGRPARVLPFQGSVITATLYPPSLTLSE